MRVKPSVVWRIFSAARTAFKRCSAVFSNVRSASTYRKKDDTMSKNASAMEPAHNQSVRRAPGAASRLEGKSKECMVAMVVGWMNSGVAVSTCTKHPGFVHVDNNDYVILPMGCLLLQGSTVAKKPFISRERCNATYWLCYNYAIF